MGNLPNARPVVERPDEEGRSPSDCRLQGYPDPSKPAPVAQGFDGSLTICWVFTLGDRSFIHINRQIMLG